jgi:hypothetical protein
LYDCSINVKINQKEWQRATKHFYLDIFEIKKFAWQHFDFTFTVFNMEE